MRRTKLHSATRGWAFGSRRTLAALFLSVALTAPVPLAASGPETEDKLINLAAQAIDFVIADDPEAAMTALAEADALAKDTTLRPAIRALPLLPHAELSFRNGDWNAVTDYATRFEAAMNANGFAAHEFRIEATVLRAVALYETGNTKDAEALLRQAVADTDALSEEYIGEELGRYYLALAASVNRAEDAATLRAEMLEYWQGRGFVEEHELHYLRYPGILLNLDIPESLANRPLTEDQLHEMSDAGLDLAEVGDFNGGFALIGRANDYTHEAEFPLLVEFYPALSFARYYYLKEDWVEMQRFAAATASIFDRDEYKDHPYRIEATIYQGIALIENGRPGEAEVLLRGAMRDSADSADMEDLNELAHYFLARAATTNKATDQSELRETFMARFKNEYLITNQQALHLLFLSLQAVVEAGEPPEQLITQSNQLIELAAQLPGVEDIYLSFFRGYHGNLLYKAEKYAEAREFFEEREAFLRDKENISTDFAVNAIRLANSVARTDDVPEALEYLTGALNELLEVGTAQDWALADIMAQLGFFHRWGNDEDEAQRFFRMGYSEVRKNRRVSDRISKRYAVYVDPDHPAMKDYPLAAELGAVDLDAFALSAGGEGTIRKFLEGNYLELERLLDAYAEQGMAETPEYLINLAVYKALVGAYEESQQALDTARRQARTTLGSSIPANAAIFDMIDLISKVYGTLHLVDKAGDAMARLAAREDTMTPGQRSLFLSLNVMAKYQSGADAGIRADLRRWMAAQPETPTQAPDVLEEWAFAMMLEPIFTYFGPEEGEIWIARYSNWAGMDRENDLRLLRDTVRLTHLFSSPTLYSSDNTLSEMSGLAYGILDLVPRDHSVVAATQFNLANMFWSRNRLDEALKWMQAATDSWRENPYHRKDTLAFLISRQANIMMQLGQNDVAATIAREAYDMIDIYKARADLAAGVVMVYAYAVRSRNGSPEMGGAIIQRHIEDAVFMKRLPPRDRMSMHQNYADMLANYGELPQVLEQLDLAENALEDNGQDWRPDLSQIALTRAIAVYWASDYDAAWSEIKRANDIKANWRHDTIRDGDGEDVSAVEAQNRAAWEAIIGWDYAATLPPEPPG